MIAKTKAKLLKNEAVKALIDKLLPIAKITTPNIPEAEVIVGYEIKNLNDVKKAAIDIKSIGVEAVVIKGGHLVGDEVID
ncbi:MAG: hydroxymethylpyrimidine/phosphomethylpyrimidine kinase, partial [Bacteroidetes bacterium]|nr:hydroxymethylpyrimidine/phosphomethylpyrimidine kinase [Bacteroidota bacterium]